MNRALRGAGSSQRSCCSSLRLLSPSRFSAAGAPAGDYAEVTATFSETSGSASFVDFCTMQESVTFGADFRIAD